MINNSDNQYIDFKQTRYADLLVDKDGCQTVKYIKKPILDLYHEK